jgi:preprotein translocase subunit YajC
MANLLFIPLVLIVGYLLLVRPQQQRVRRQQELLSSVRVGDEVVTAGGMVGRVVSLDEERVWLELAPGMTVQFLRQAIARRVEVPADEDAVAEGDSGDLDHDEVGHDGAALDHDGTGVDHEGVEGDEASADGGDRGQER